MGARHGAWCIGCCWALMASLFALGVMSVVWMAVVAGLIAFEKLIPFRRTGTYATAAILLVLRSARDCGSGPDSRADAARERVDGSDGHDEPLDALVRGRTRMAAATAARRAPM